MRGKSDEEQRINRKIAINIKKIRKENNLTQSDLAQVLGVSYQQVQKYESGINRVPFSSVYILAELYSLSIFLVDG